MKKLLIFLFAFSSLYVQAHKIYPTNGNLNSIKSSLNPGDSIVLQSALHWDVIWLQYWQNPNPSLPVVIINDSVGQAVLSPSPGFNNSGFQIQGSSGLKIVGSGCKKVRYGIKITGGGYFAVSGELGWTHDIKFDSIEIYNKPAGFVIKSEVRCDPALQFPNNRIKNIEVKYCYVHKCLLEGTYFLSTAPEGTLGTAHPTVYCNGTLDATISTGTPTNTAPLRGSGFVIEYNIFDSLGRAVQLAGNDGDTAVIAYNSITHVGSDPDGQQGNGLNFGGHCRYYAHDNYFDWIKKDAIQALGKYNHIEYNIFGNHIGNCGMRANMADSGAFMTADAHDIYVVSQGGTASPENMPYDTTEFIIAHNTFGNVSAKDGYNVFVEFGWGNYSKTKNIVDSNINAKVYARPGVNYFKLPVVPPTPPVIVVPVDTIPKDTTPVVTPPVDTTISTSPVDTSISTTPVDTTTSTPVVKDTSIISYTYSKKTHTATFVRADGIVLSYPNAANIRIKYYLYFDDKTGKLIGYQTVK